jgi:hypothetical protein
MGCTPHFRCCFTSRMWLQALQTDCAKKKKKKLTLKSHQPTAILTIMVRTALIAALLAVASTGVLGQGEI